MESHAATPVLFMLGVIITAPNKQVISSKTDQDGASSSYKAFVDLKALFGD